MTDTQPAAGARPALSHRAVLAVALPITLSNITTPLLGLADTAVIGRLGNAQYLGGIALGALIFTSICWAFGFLRMGTTGLTAQAHGAGDGGEVRASLGRPLLIALALGLMIVLLQVPLGLIAFRLLPGTEEVEALARSYLDIRIYSAPFALANYAFLGWFIGLGRAHLALALQVLLNGLNIGLDVLFVLGFGWGVEGVAAGTLLAEIGAFVGGSALALWHLRGIAGRWQRSLLLARAAMLRTLSVNGNIFLRTLALLASFGFFTAQGARAGDIVLAANAILLQFVSVSAFFLDGFALAAETFVGQAVGARRRGDLLLAVRRSTLWAAGVSLVLGLVIVLLGPHFIRWLTTEPDVRAAATAHYLWAAAIPVAGVWCYQLDGIFVGATRSRDMRNASLMSLMGFLGLWWLLRPFGNHGLWLAFCGFMLLRAATLLVFYPALVRSVPEAAAAEPVRSANPAV